jgi:hypothetical protein
MNIKLQNIRSGMAAGKQTVVVEGYGSFQVTYVEHPTLSTMSTLYISHSIKNADIKLCFCLLDIAEHLGCDCDEMVNNLPKGWDKERTNSFGLYY